MSESDEAIIPKDWQPPLDKVIAFNGRKVENVLVVPIALSIIRKQSIGSGLLLGDAVRARAKAKGKERANRNRNPNQNLEVILEQHVLLLLPVSHHEAPLHQVARMLLLAETITNKNVQEARTASFGTHQFAGIG